MELRHVAFIPDGNRRYAKKYGLSYAKAYELGFNKAKQIMVDWRDMLDDNGINRLTFWALSTENLLRNKVELSIIFNYMRKVLRDSLSSGELDDYKIGVNFVGKLELLPEDLRQLMVQVSNETRKYKDLVVDIAVAYGGKSEILDAVKKVIDQGLELTEENLNKYLYIPLSPDLIIRTSGTIRTSGFLPLQAAYSEWYFSDKLWPEFDRAEMKNAIDNYFSRERKFGR